MTTEFVIGAIVAISAAVAFHLYRLLRMRTASNDELVAGKARLEIELQQAREERNRLLDALGDAFLLVDPEGNIRFANAAARGLFDGRELIGRPVREAFIDPRLAEALVRSLTTGEPVQSRVV